VFPVRPYEGRPHEQRRDDETDHDNQQDQYLRHRRRIPALNWQPIRVAERDLRSMPCDLKAADGATPLNSR
jgi:hypothetical protein